MSTVHDAGTALDAWHDGGDRCASFTVVDRYTAGVPDVLAVISKAIFEKVARGMEPGAVWTTTSYASQNKGLTPLKEGGRLFLVTVRPPDEALWLVAVLDNPKFNGTEWKSRANTIPVRDVSSIKKSLRFANDSGLPNKKGVLGMSLQTPRVLAATDGPILLGAAKATTAKAATAAKTSKTAKALKAPKNGGAVSKAATKGAAAVDGGALASAVAGWRKTRHLRFAALAVALSDKEAPRPLVGKGKRAVDRAAWDALEHQRDPRDLPRLLATLGSANSPDAAERVRLLSSWDDPRLVPGLLGILAKPPYTGGTSKKFWQTVIATLQDSNDVRAHDGMITLSKRYKHINGTFMGEWIAGALSRAAAKMKMTDADSNAASAFAVPAAIEQKLAALEMEVFGESGSAAASNAAAAADPKQRKSPKSSAASLESVFEKIVANPDDDEPRLVYADMLSEKGDERGEFIVLQVDRAAGRGSAARSDIEREKFVDSGMIEDEWEAPLSAAAEFHAIDFARGFPVAIELAAKGLALVAGAIEWGTVRILKDLRRAPVKALITLLESPHARNLIEVHSLDARVLAKVTAAKTFPWSTVSARADGLTPAALERMPSLTSLEILGEGNLTSEIFAAAPGLKSLTLAYPANASAKLLSDENAAKLESLTLQETAQLSAYTGLRNVHHLDIRCAPTDARAWLAAFPSVTSLVLRGSDKINMKNVRAIFDAHPKLAKLTLMYFDDILDGTIERSGKGSKGSFTITVPPGRRWPTFHEKIASVAPALQSIGVTLMKLYPSGPRHIKEPMAASLISETRKAWSPGKLELPELL